MPSLEIPETPQTEPRTKSKEKSKKKDKDRSEKKSSKKRRREDEGATDAISAVRAESPSKRARTTSPTQTAQWSAVNWRLTAAEQNGGHTPFHEQTTSFYLSLSPVSLRHPLKGLCAEHLSPLILTYHPPLEGVALSYRNVSLSTYQPSDPNTSTSHGDQGGALAQQIDEYAPSFVWLTATFLLLKLERGVWLDAVVNLQNESHLGLIVWNLFAASIPRERLPKQWRWRDVTPGTSAKNSSSAEEWPSDEHGYFIDGEGKRLPRQISFRVRDFEAAPATEGDRGFISISGTLLSDEEEGKLEATEGQREQARTKRRHDQDRRDLSMAGALNGNAQTDRMTSAGSQTPNGSE